MGLIKRAADLTYTFRFIRMLVMDWKEWDAYKEGIINAEGKRNRNVKIDNDAKKSAYTPFIRLCANVKRLVSNIPGGSSKLGSFASALYLIKEHYKLNDKQIEWKNRPDLYSEIKQKMSILYVSFRTNNQTQSGVE